MSDYSPNYSPDYSRLPTLVLNEIFGYLSVKERVKAKSVCRTWRAEIELRERKRDTLVLHLGPYPWNIRWSETNNRRLMKFENSFQMKHLEHFDLAFLEHPMTRALLEKTKKLAIIDSHNFFDPKISSIQPYLGYLDCCEEIEFRSMLIGKTVTFDLPKLKVLVFHDSPALQITLNCPSLEVLFWNEELPMINFRDVKKLKRLICFGWPATVSSNGKFDALESLNLYTARDERVSNRLLDLMPKLKRLVLYSRNPQADLEILREQQKRLGLKNLEILFNGFRDTVSISLGSTIPRLMVNWSVEQLHENYSKLMENSPWRACIDYSKLFRKFKILPSNFFERFSESLAIEITEVINHTHLLGFLKCCPFVEQLNIHSFSKLKGERILDMVHSLQPSIKCLAIVEERPSDLLKIDLSFLRLLDLPQLYLRTTRLPVEFVRKVAARRGSYFFSNAFKDITTHHQIAIRFSSNRVYLFDDTCRSKTPAFPSIEPLIAHMQSDTHLSTFLL